MLNFQFRLRYSPDGRKRQWRKFKLSRDENGYWRISRQTLSLKVIVKTLYEILGVPVDATDAQIKRAFRKLVKKTHPDKPGGSAEKFTPIAHAYEVLSDPMRRERYDKTGYENDPKVADAAQKCAMVLSQIVLVIANQNLPDCNVIQSARDTLKIKIQNLTQTADNYRQQARTLRGMAENVQKRGQSDNIIASVLISHANGCESEISKIKEDVDTLEDVLQVLKDYIWKPDQNPDKIPEVRSIWKNCGFKVFEMT